jgi:hypothetical protein
MYEIPIVIIVFTSEFEGKNNLSIVTYFFVANFVELIKLLSLILFSFFKLKIASYYSTVKLGYNELGC